MEEPRRTPNKNPKGINFYDDVLQLLSTEREKDKTFSKTVNRLLREHLTSCNKKSGGNTLDTEILQKLIPVFVSKRLKVDLEPEEIARIKELLK